MAGLIESVEHVSPAKADIPGFRSRGRLGTRSAVLVNILVAIITLVTYQAIYLLAWPVTHHPNTRLTSRSAGLEPRDDGQEASNPEASWDSV